MSAEFDAVVIGAGVCGLACARALVQKGQRVVVVERHRSIGQEISSRNSEVIHSGIYYPKDSLKTKLCLEGRTRLYAYCSQFGISHQKTGKYVVSTSKSEDLYLESLFEHARSLGVPAQAVSGKTLQTKEPCVQVRSGLYFPESGIVDSHALMASLARQIDDGNSILALGHTFQKANYRNGTWEVHCSVQDETLVLTGTTVVNASGLSAAHLSNRVFAQNRFEHRLCRGRYLAARGKLASAFRSLVYPVPGKDGLGIHVTIDTNGQARFGPDVDWWTSASWEGLYEYDWEALRETFLSQIRRYCPNVAVEDFGGSFVGVRPKLFVDGIAHPDFLIHTANAWTDLLGIESPGLTAALALAEAVAATY